MKIEKTTILAFVAITFISGLFTKANANLLVNGSFETGPNPGTLDVITINSGSHDITGWEVAPDRIDYIGGHYWVASDGNRSLDLDNSPGFGGIMQTFATTAGVDYLVTFAMAGNPYTGKNDPLIKHMGVEAAGDSTDFSFNATGHNNQSMGWETKSWQFTANSNSTTLEFYSLDSYEREYSGWCGPALDNVSVVVIPEPATMALLGLGFVALLRKRRMLTKPKPLFICLLVFTLLSINAYAESILDSAADYAVLAGTPNITNTGTTTITGNVGIAPAASITGKGPGADQIILTGAYHENDTDAQNAKTDLTKAYTGLNLMPATQTLTSNELGGRILPSGVYNFLGNPATVLLTAGAGALTLDAGGNNNAYWVFQIPNALTTTVGSSVVVDHFGSNGGNDNGVFWTVGSSAAIFGDTSFEGNILALTSITLGLNATILNGRALARNGTVTMNTNTISIVCPLEGPGHGGPGYSGGLMYDNSGNVVPVPEPATLCLLGLGALSLLRRKRSA